MPGLRLISTFKVKWPRLLSLNYLKMSNVPSSHGETGLAVTAIMLAFGKLVEWLVQAEHALAAASYVVAIVAGIVTVYYKIKKKG